MSDLKLTPAEERVKAYLEEQIKNDAALAAVYNPSKIKDCFTYITDQARKVASGISYFADDAEVWKWARDYFIEGLPKTEEKSEPAVDITPVQEAVKEASAELEEDAKKDNVKRTALGFEIFGEESDEPKEELSEEPCHQEEEIEVEEEPAVETPEEEKAVRYDEDGQALLFDFM